MDQTIYFAIFAILAFTITISSAAATTFTDEDLIVDQTSGSAVIESKSTGGTPAIRLTDVGSRSFDIRIVDGTKDLEIFDNTAAKTRLIILQNGRIGIGTTTPATDMDLVSVTTDFRLLSTAGNSLFTMNADGGWAAFRLTDKSFKAYDVRMLDGTGRLDIYDKTLNQVRLSVANNGHIGIGTITPAEKLDVKGNIRLTGNIVSPNDICIGNCP